jgi:Fuc2NAc and GlcNAc transferase
MFFLLIICSALLTLILGGIFYRYNNIPNLIDVPNSRSSHASPTLKGGGVVIMFTFIAFLMGLYYLDILSSKIYLDLVMCSCVIGLVGFMDDIKEVNPRIRLVIHFLTAAIGLYLLNGFKEVLFLGDTVNLGLLGNVLAMIYIVWFLNLYNFMDGIDGIASLQAITVCGAFAFINFWIFPSFDLWKVSLLFTSCILGFLYWNFPKAKIFLGDTGSGFIGFFFALFSIEASNNQPVLLWVFLILMSVFLVDATLTLFYRIYNNEVIFKAHSSHAYQKATTIFNSHILVTNFICLINLLWLFPMAFLVALGLIQGIVGLGIAIFPLTLLFIYLQLIPNSE